MSFYKISQITIIALSFGIASLQAMEAPVSKYQKAKEHLKAHFEERMANCPLEQAEIIGFGEIMADLSIMQTLHKL